MNRRSLFAFITVLLLISWAVQVAAIYFVRDLESDRAVPWLVATMFIPTLAAVIYRLVFNRDAFRHVSLRPGHPLYLLVAALIPAATALAVVAVVQAANWGYCDFFEFSRNAVEFKKGPWQLGLGVQSWPMFVLNIAVTAVVFAVMNSIVAVGEEFAWRGFLQRPMIDQFGTAGGVALLGLVWAMWHLPSILAGYNYPQTPVLGGLVLFPLLLVSESFVMAWLTLRAKSFWPAVLMHGSGNGIHEGIISHIRGHEGVSRLPVDLTAVMVSVFLGLICLLALLRSQTPRAFFRPQ